MRRIDLQLFAEERKHPATPRKRQRARREGRVARSAELGPAVALVGLLALAQAYAPLAVQQLMTFTARSLAQPKPVDWRIEDVAVLGQGAGLLFWQLAGPFLLAAAALGTLLGVAQVGLAFQAQGLAPRWQVVNPMSGLQRIFSLRSLAELLKAFGKLAAVALLAYFTVVPALPGLLRLGRMELADGVAWTAGVLLGLLWRVAAVLVLFAVADLLYQRWELERVLRMSQQELREETKETEGDPRLRARRRQRQREWMRQWMLAEVARADVVVANPTHYAVALRYRPADMPAPRVVAKGRGYLAQRIRQLAREHDVVIVEDPPLARTLYASVKVGHSVPVELYQAVAEVLAFVWRLRQYREARQA